MSYTKDRLFTDQELEMLVIAMVENDAFNGIIGKKTFHFQHFDLNKVALYRNAVRVPGQALTWLQ